MTSEVTVVGQHDQRTIDQLTRCVEAEPGAIGVLCADGHLGYSMPIGGAIAYREHLSPSGVGYDIGCGNKAVKTELFASQVRTDLPRIMDEIFDRISFGVGRKNNERIDHPVLDAIAHAEFEPQRDLLATAAAQLGTVGAGNHYVDLFEDEDGRLWVGVHFGSRGFGHKTASGFLAMNQGKAFDEKGSEGEMESPPILFHEGGYLYWAYERAMKLAGEYAYAGRDVVVDRVLEILGAHALDTVHNHHNFAWREEHHGEDFWVVRKGCTPAFPGQRGFVGATMGETSVILEGSDPTRDSELEQRMESLLCSTVHGAGRAMSRTQAAGKQQNVAECTARDCDSYVPWKQYRAARETAGLREEERYTTCERHPDGKMKKVRRRTREGAVDFDAARADLRERGIHLRGGAADEAPLAYKRLDEVLDAQGDSIRVTHRLKPIGVAMAGADTFDPFKD